MQDSRKNICQDCPFRRNASPGWLGASTAQQFLERVERQVPMECHTDFDYTREDWQNHLFDADTVLCVGAAHYLANTASRPRDREWGAAVVRRGPSERVFANREEFLAYHDNEINKRYVEISEEHASGYIYPIARDE